MQNGRIFFVGNPWPEGHPLKSFDLKPYVKDGYVWFRIDFETEDYYSERDIDTNQEHTVSDWESSGVWSNYHACNVTANDGFAVCPLDDFSMEFLSGRVFKVDTLPLTKDFDELAFHIYLLGHDSIADHTIRFVENEVTPNTFDIEWQGRIALTYAGDDEFKYEFRAEIKGVEIPAPQT